MAIIRISAELFNHKVQEAFLLPGKVDSVITEKYNFPRGDPDTYLVMFDAPGFGSLEIVQGFYERTESGLKLKELVSVGEFRPED